MRITIEAVEESVKSLQLGKLTIKEIISLTEAKAHRLSVLLVEDEAIIRMMIAGMIEELGHDVVAEAGNIADALKLAKTVDFGIAILDINVGGEMIEPVTEIIHGRLCPSFLPAVMGQPDYRKDFVTEPCCKSPF